jgi:hypothetical protein
VFDASVNSSFGTVTVLLLGGCALALLGGCALLVARIGALMELAKSEEWVWFVLVIIFNWVVVLLYLIAGPKPRPLAQYVPSPPYPVSTPGQSWPGVERPGMR